MGVDIYDATAVAALAAEDEHRARDAADHQAVADQYFGGDAAAADALLHALPYSAVPGWDDVRTVLDALVEIGAIDHA